SAQYIFASSQPTNEYTWQVRGDHKISDSDSMFARYTFLNSTRLTTNTFPYDFTDDHIKNQSAALEEDRIFSSTLLNTFRFGFSRNFPKERDYQDPPVPLALHFVPSVETMGSISVERVSGVGNAVPGEYRGVNSF